MRTTVAAAVLLIGIGWLAPMQSGHGDTAPAAPRYSAAVPASFSIASTRGTLTLSGHTISKAHERRLREVVAAHYPGLELKTEFRPLGVAPDWWGTATTALLEAITVVDAPRATVEGASILVRGIVSNRAMAEPRLRAVRAALPDGTALDLRLTEIDPAVSPATLCQRQLRTLRFPPIYFDESGTRMRTSAFRALEQAAAFADACRDTMVSITGHTDSSGDESYNRALSLARAQTVADWLQQRGIGAHRLQVDGAGSSMPVADNATRFGRGLNRRIDIAFSAKAQE